MQEPQRAQKKYTQRAAEKCRNSPCETLRPSRLCLTCPHIAKPRRSDNCALSYEMPIS